MNLEKKDIIIFILFLILFYKVFFVSEKMANVSQTDIENAVKKVYDTDVEAIRNLSGLATNLTKDGKLVVPGGLEIDGSLTVKQNLTVDKNSLVTGNSEVKGQTTIHTIYGGKSNGSEWRDIQVNGNNLRFVIGENKYGFHSNSDGFHFYKNNTNVKFPIHKGIEKITTDSLDATNITGTNITGTNIIASGILKIGPYIFSSTDKLLKLNKDNFEKDIVFNHKMDHTSIGLTNPENEKVWYY